MQSACNEDLSLRQSEPILTEEQTPSLLQVLPLIAIKLEDQGTSLGASHSRLRQRKKLLQQLLATVDRRLRAWPLNVKSLRKEKTHRAPCVLKSNKKFRADLISYVRMLICVFYWSFCPLIEA
jgi:hypothetical protein